MKKTLSLLLALCLLCAGAALAEENQLTPDQQTGTTTVTYTVEEKPSEFVVTIPANVSIPQGATSATMQISIDAGSTLATGETLAITLESSANNFALKHADQADTLSYTVRQGGENVVAGGKILTWNQGEAIPSAAELTLTVESSEGHTPGEYTDTLTFKATLTESGFNASHEGFEDGPTVDW